MLQVVEVSLRIPNPIKESPEIKSHVLGVCNGVDRAPVWIV